MAFSTEQGYPRLLKYRADDDLELCTWDAGGIKPQQIYLFSLSSGPEPVHLSFVNNTNDVVTIIWLSFCGAEVAYGLIHPKKRFEIWTFKTHPWIARRGNSAAGARLMLGDSMVVFPETARPNTPITQPPLLTWSLQTHKHFPVSFRNRAKQLLLSHAFLCKQAAARRLHANSSRLTRSKSKALSTGTSLDAIPFDVLIHIISFMAPPQRQCITLLPDGHPGIPPARLPYDPATRSGTCLRCGGSHTG